MNADRISNIFAAIVTVALVTTIVAHPATARIVSAGSSGFAEILLAAMGKRQRR